MRECTERLGTGNGKKGFSPLFIELSIPDFLSRSVQFFAVRSDLFAMPLQALVSLSFVPLNNQNVFALLHQ